MHFFMRGCLSFALLLFAGCAGSPLATGAKAEENTFNMAYIRIGMSEDQVYDIMGRPYDIESYDIDKEYFEVWFYLTRKVALGQTRLVPGNFTPLVFQDGFLVGWGRNYYNHLLDIENAKEKRREDLRQRYTDDEDEWPPQTHQIIPGQDPIQEEPEKEIEEKVRPGKEPRKTKKYFSS